MASPPIDLAAHFDPEIIPGMNMVVEQKRANRIPVHDVESRRANVTRLFTDATSNLVTPPGVATTVYETKLADGHMLKMYWHYKESSAAAGSKGPAILHVHGGGYIAGSAELVQKFQQTMVGMTNIPMLSVEYRLPPEHPHPIPVEDAYAGLQWLHANAEKLGVDTARIASMGESAGGGLAACLTLLARDRGLSPPLKQQVLIYPMLDDTNTQSRGDMEGAYLWDSIDNATGWAALVGSDKVGTDAVSEYAAPPRAKSLKGLPTTYIDVGSMDLFIQEDVDYAARLIKDGVPTEAHVYLGMPHGFEMFLQGSKSGESIMQNRFKFLSQL